MTKYGNLKVRWGRLSRSNWIALAILLAIGFLVIANDWRVIQSKLHTASPSTARN